MSETLRGRLSALFCTVVWGSTFIASKVLLRSFSSVTIIVLRFAVGCLALTLLRPRRLRLKSSREQGLFALAGLTGVTLYFMLENSALLYTMAANVGIIIATVPFFTGVIAALLPGSREPLRVRFIAGFIIALVGIALISLNGARLQMNPVGDLMTLGAALCWAVYCLLLRRINTLGYDNLLVTRRIFGWGLVFMLPFAAFGGFRVNLQILLTPKVLGIFAYLGMCACAVCYLLWNEAVRLLGPVRTNLFLYLEPLVTLAFSIVLLHEPVTPLSLAGSALILCGLLLSEERRNKQKP